MLLALMDEAYTGSAIEDPIGNSGSDDTGPLDLADPMFLDLLKDENDGIAVSNSSYAILYILIDFPLNF
jgi:AP-5 complex subunit zeta-1